MRRFYASLGTICLSWLGMGGRRKRWLSTVVYKCVAIAATQFSMCKISTMPLRTYSLRCWITILYPPKSARMPLWCSPVISIRTALASVYNRSAPCSWTVVFHTIKPHRWPLPSQGCQYLSLFFSGWGAISVLDSLTSDLIRMKYYRVFKSI